MNPFTSGTLNKFLGQLCSFHCFSVFILSLFRYLFILKIFTDFFNPSPAVQFLALQLSNIGLNVQFKFAFACVGGFHWQWVQFWSSLAVTWARGCCSQTHVNDLGCYTAVNCLPSLPCWCEAADHHVGHTLLQSYKSPTVGLGPNGTATAGNGQAHQGGRGMGGDRRCSPLPTATNALLPCSPLRQPCSLTLPATPVWTQLTASSPPAPPQLLPLIAFISVSMGAAARSNLLIMYCISTGPGAGMEHRGVPGSDARSALLLPGRLLPFYRSTTHLLFLTSVSNHSPSSQRHTLKTSHLSYFVPKRQTTVSFCLSSSPNNHHFDALQ